MRKADGGDQKAHDACHQLAEWRRQFWQAVEAGDRELALRIQGRIIDYPDVITHELYNDPAVAHAWSDARSDTDLKLSFMRATATPREVWVAKAEIERLGDELDAAPMNSQHGDGNRRPEQTVFEAHQHLREYFASLPPVLRQHPVLRHTMSRSQRRITWVNAAPLPPLSDQERAELKFLRLYRWTHDLRPILFTTEISPHSEAAADEWFENELTTEQRVRAVVATRGGRVVNLSWVEEGGEFMVVLTYAVDREEDADRVIEGFAETGVFSVTRTRRLFTSEDLRFRHSPPFPFSDSFREQDLDEEELEAYLSSRRRAEERKRAILATTPCRTCGRFVEPGEPSSIDVVADRASLEEGDESVTAETPVAVVYCSQHRR